MPLNYLPLGSTLPRVMFQGWNDKITFALDQIGISPFQLMQAFISNQMKKPVYVHAIVLNFFVIIVEVASSRCQEV